MALSEEELKARKNARQRAYSKKPEVRARKRVLAQTPEAKAVRKAYDRTPEARARARARDAKPERKARKREYEQTPEAKARHKAWEQRPENKARRRELWQRPEFKARRKAKNRLRKYNLTADQWNLLFASQDFECAICGTGDPAHSLGWATDHSYVTGKVRGILCQRCNRVLGMLGDEHDKAKTYIAKILKYLEPHRG